ncbi:MAG TPA: AAA family ATPase [Anaerolineae bacterium]|nr:AAA family ATPase [Anaerolineae bacterium]
MSDINFHLAGMEILKEIGRGTHSVVYQAERNGRLYAIKVMQDNDRNRTERARLRFRREAGIMARLKHPGLPSTLEIGDYKGQLYLVTEYVGGRSLAALLAKGNPLPESQIIYFAKTLAGALGEVHRHGQVHRDIKPANILINEAGHPKLIDFGFAAQAEDDELVQGVVGTFLYSAPEQTGMLRRPVDGRADLYALGVVLFECATGTLPFQSANMNELLNQHATVPAPDVRQRNSSISPGLAAIIAKLLYKDPDDRYQTGQGLMSDLQKLESINANLQSGQDVNLGVDDQRERVLHMTPLVGRDAELAQLQQQWKAAMNGNGQAGLVLGEEGLGKSRVVQTLLQHAGDSGALILTGRCVEADPLPFSPFRQAIDQLLQSLHRLPPIQKQRAEKQIRSAMGDLAPLLKRFTPLMTAFLKDVPDLAEGEDVHEQFLDGLAHFILELSTEQGAAIFYLDDVHWLDNASHRILRRIVRQLHRKPFLLVMTSRAGEAGIENVYETLAHTKSAALNELSLAPLETPAVSQLVSNYLGDYKLDKNVIEILTNRSQGNPFVVTEYLQAMIDAGLLRPKWGAWGVDTDGIEKLKLANNVVDLVIRRLEEVSHNTRRVLMVAAAIGAQFSLTLLAKVSEQDDEDLGRALDSASTHNLVEITPEGDYIFVHERIREALLNELEADNRRDLHQRIAEELDTLEIDSLGADQVYMLARQYALGDVSKRPLRVYETNFAAGQLAQQNFAFDEAYIFFQQAVDALKKTTTPHDPHLDEALSDICFRTGRIEEAITCIDHALQASNNPHQRALLFARKAQIHLNARDNINGWAAVGKGFAELGMPLPQVTASHLLRTIGTWGRWLLSQATNAGYGSATDLERERLQIMNSLYATSGYLAYMSSNSIMLLQVGLRPLILAHKLGDSRELVHVYGSYSIIMSVLGRRKTSEKYAQMAVDTAHRMDDRVSIGHSLYIQSMAYHVGGDVRQAEQISKECLHNYGRWMDGFDYSVACGDLALNLTMRGYIQDAWNWTQRAQERAQISGDALFLPYAGAMLAILGRSKDGRGYLQRTFQMLDDEMVDTYRWSLYLGYKILFHVELGELGTPINEAIALHRKLNLRPDRMTFQLRYIFVYYMYACLMEAWRAVDEGKAEAQQRLQAALADLKKAATTAVLKTHYMIGQAGLDSLQGSYETASKLFATANQLALEYDNPWALFEIARWQAHSLQQQNNVSMATQQALQAYHVAIEHGWTSRARQVQMSFPHIHTGMAATNSVASQSLTTSVTQSRSVSGSDGAATRLQRYLDALLQISLASANLLDPDQQARSALDEIVQILAAERAFLLLVDTNNRMGELLFRAGRDAYKEDLSEAADYSRTVVEQVRLTQQPIVISNSEEGAVIGSESIVSKDIRSVLATPLLLEDELVGVVYLDNRLARGVFTNEDVRILLAIANHIAIALRVTEMIDVIRDRTEALETAYTQLEKLDHTKTQFIEIASHELRTPLTVLDGYCQLLLNDAKIKENGYWFQLVDGIYTGGKRLHEIINSMIDMTRVDNQSLVVHPEPVNLALVLKDADTHYQQAWKERNITLQMNMDVIEAIPQIEGDDGLLKKVFRNLVGNAIKYTPDGGCVTITTEEIPAGSGGWNQGAIEIIISDTGIGIDPEYHDLIFTKFYQTGEVSVHSSGKTKFKGGGPGLGLTIAKGVVEAHGGRVWVDSPGYDEENFPGSHFHVILPLVQVRQLNPPIEDLKTANQEQQ